MRALLQRVSAAKVVVDGKVHNEIEKGLLILLGIEFEDSEEDARWLCSKIAKMRLFPDQDKVMNLSVQEVGGEFLVIANSLYTQVPKRQQTELLQSLKTHHSEPLYEYFMEHLWMESDLPVKGGKFGADMKLHLVNDGPVTIWIDSKNKE